jgi:glyoxylase-like metal-dependent hydrolase (beta-lactamase superfamily II)
MELTGKLHAFLWTSFSANNCNTYLIRTAGKCILIDPGHEAHFDHVALELRRLGLSVGDMDLIVGTHAHPDHIEAVGLFDRRRTLFTLHSAEWAFVQDMAPYLRASMGMDPEPLSPDFFLQEGSLEVGDVSLEVIHAPGHSPGGVVLYWPEAAAIFAGDLIFRDGLGRTDLPGGNGERLKESILRISELDAELLLPGHGEIVSGAAAVRRNFERVEGMWFGYV